MLILLLISNAKINRMCEHNVRTSLFFANKKINVVSVSFIHLPYRLFFTVCDMSSNLAMTSSYGFLLNQA